MGTKVLVVDDDSAFGEVVQAILSSAGIKADFLTSGQQALERLGKEKFDAVFLDIRMPSPDGIELARTLRASSLNQRTPIVMITGDRDPAALTRAFNAGANFFLFKPVDQQRLLRVVRASEGLIQREKRRFQRVRIAVETSLMTNGKKLQGRTLDLSLGGLLVQAGGVLPAGSRVGINLQLKKGAPPLQLKGHVVRIISDGCMGIQFQALGAAESEGLQEFLLPLILRTSEAGPPPARGDKAGAQ